MRLLKALLAVRLAAAATIVVSDQQSGFQGSKAVDNNVTSFWHSQYSPTTIALPHTATIDLGSIKLLNGFNYLPRQDGNANGRIGQYTLEASTDNSAWTQIASGTWPDDPSKKYAGFPNRNLRYFRLKAITEAGSRGPWTSAAEFGFNVAPTSTTNGQWGPMIPFPLVPAAAFVIPTSGNILTFSANSVKTFGGSGNTYTSTYNPSTGSVSLVNVQNTGHDMFCPGMSLDANGQVVVTGGDDEAKTSSYIPSSNSWVSKANMQIPRGYQASATCSDGRIFTIGGSWSGGLGGKNGEIFNPTANTWTLLPGCPVAPMLTVDAQGIFREDNHGWLFGWKSGSVFQAGPSKAMNWYNTNSVNGTQSSAGLRAADSDSMDGNAVMYDAVAGKIVTFGGSQNYQNSDATKAVHLITIGNPNTAPTVSTLTSMTYARAFANAVVLPNGKVFVTGGQSYAVPFSDNTAILTPELWDPATQSFTIIPAHIAARTYHSVALLMLDGRVFTGGGGLCNDCTTNHFDGQIYSPAYLFTSGGALATRPVISSISATDVQVGSAFTVTTDSAVSSFSLVRYGSATHTVNTDQRRVPLTPSATSGTTYTLTVPSDSGIAIPGYWMVFVINSAGVPSVAKSIRVYI